MNVSIKRMMVFFLKGKMKSASLIHPHVVSNLFYIIFLWNPKGEFLKNLQAAHFYITTVYSDRVNAKTSPSSEVHLINNGR